MEPAVLLVMLLAIVVIVAVAVAVIASTAPQAQAPPPAQSTAAAAAPAPPAQATGGAAAAAGGATGLDGQAKPAATGKGAAASAKGPGVGPNADGSWPALPPLGTISLDKTKTWRVRATYYGPDRIHGIHGGNDNLFEHIGSGGYTADQLRKIGSHFCAMSEKFLKKGFMGKIINIKGSKGSADFVVVDLLPDRNDGKGVEIDVHDQKDWLMLGGDEAVGIQEVQFKLVGTASIPPLNSAWDPKKLGIK